jgi:hypothetical protein
MNSAEADDDQGGAQVMGASLDFWWLVLSALVVAGFGADIDKVPLRRRQRGDGEDGDDEDGLQEGSRLLPGEER